MECVDAGSVADILKYGYKSGFDDETVIAQIFCEVLQFLVYLHGRRQIHRGICMNNVLLNPHGEVKVGDLGSATELIRAGQRIRATYTVMDSAYTAPEVMVEGTGYGPAADIWSLGILAYAMATGQTPFDELQQLQKVQAIISGPPPELNGENSTQLKDFVKQCLQKDPRKRASAAALLKHPFLRKGRE
jgi:serine/threonine protein kinase